MTLSGKRIIVTGSDGFVGSHLVQRLEQEGVEVIHLDIKAGVDITDWEQIKSYHDIDIVYHLAAKTYIPAAVKAPGENYRINLMGTVNMLELARLNGVEKFIFASSYIYGNPQHIPINEEHAVNPPNPYSRSKALGEDLCRGYYEDYGLKCVIIRPFNIYGEGQSQDFLIPSILKQVGTGQIELESAEPKRDFLYIDDAVEAYVRAGGYSGSGFEVFNIGSGTSYSVSEIVAKVLAISGKRAEVSYRNRRSDSEVMNTVADISKAKHKLRWEPGWSLEEGLSKLIQNTLKGHPL